jgi:hypothetical protein
MCTHSNAVSRMIICYSSLGIPQAVPLLSHVHILAYKFLDEVHGLVGKQSAGTPQQRIGLAGGRVTPESSNRRPPSTWQR